MGRLPSNGAPVFRFTHSEVAHMEAIIQEHQGQVPAKEFLMALAEKFSNSPERAGKVIVQMKQVWSWFQNRRFALRSKTVKAPKKLNISPVAPNEGGHMRNVPPTLPQVPPSSGHNVVSKTSENPMEFEAKSAKDGAWYDVQAFISHRYLETGNPEVKVRFAGVWPEEEEWVNIRLHVRQRSLPCEAAECVAVLAGDLVLCFQEGKEQALYFDAHVLDAQRRRHDIRGCRCRFLVRYDHDQSEEIVPLRKICRRPETDYRLQILNTTKEASSSVSGDPQKHVVDPTSSNSSNTTVRMTTPKPSATAVPIRSIHMSPAATASSPAPVPTPVLAPVSTTTVVPGPSSSHFVQVALTSQKPVAESNKPEEALIGGAPAEASRISSEHQSTVTVNVKNEPVTCGLGLRGSPNQGTRNAEAKAFV